MLYLIKIKISIFLDPHTVQEEVSRPISFKRWMAIIHDERSLLRRFSTITDKNKIENENHDVKSKNATHSHNTLTKDISEGDFNSDSPTASLISQSSNLESQIPSTSALSRVGDEVLNEKSVVEDKSKLNAFDDSRDNISSKHDSANNSSVATYLNDDVISADVGELLSINSDAKGLLSDALIIFENFSKVSNAYIVPDSELSHLKDKENALTLIMMERELYVRWSVWKDLYVRYIMSNRSVLKHLQPISRAQLRNLNKHVLSSPKLMEDPMWSLAPLSNSLASILYGTAIGAGDLLAFTPSKYIRLVYTLKYLSDVSKSPTVDLTLHSRDSDTTIHCDVLVKSFDPKKITNRTFSLDPERSMYSTDSLSLVLSKLLKLDTAMSDFETTQTSTSERVAITVKSYSPKSADFADAFLSAAVVNEDYVFYIEDKSMLDMFFSLFFIKSLGFSKCQEEQILNYVTTVLYKYVQNGMYIKTGIRISRMAMNIELIRNDRYVTEPELSSFFRQQVDEGNLTPITPLHYHALLDKEYEYQKWMPFMFWSCIVNPNINDHLMAFQPNIDMPSKIRFKMIALDRSMLSTNYYQSNKCLDFQKAMNDFLTFEQFLSELYVRSLMVDDVPDYFPLISKGQWKGSSVSSFAIASPILHRIAKFGLPSHVEIIYDHVRKITMRDEKPPTYVRNLTRLTESLPSIFKCLVPSDDYEGSFVPNIISPKDVKGN